MAAALGGEVAGDGLIVVERRFSLDLAHGVRRLRDMLGAPLDCLEGDLPCAEELLFLDTETTGLAGGTGTLPFLVGLARIEGDYLCLRQLFLTGFKGERALLAEAAPWCRQARHLVTFNGKTFDVPLLAARYRLARLPDPLVRLGHLDLLHPLRTAFGAAWPDCRLQTAERRLLDFHRQDDLPGHLVPQAWFDFVRARRMAQLPAILAHNRWDLISLVTLAARLARLFDRPDHPEADVLGIARRLRRRGDEGRARQQLSANQAVLGRDGLLELAGLYRRRRQWPHAVAIWERLAGTGCTESLERLAKYHEHVARDWITALRYAQALAARRPGDEAAARRVERLMRRLAGCD